jgi:hypothetical protein
MNAHFDAIEFSEKLMEEERTIKEVKSIEEDRNNPEDIIPMNTQNKLRDQEFESRKKADQ